MFKNYLITAVRNLRKNKAHSFINIAGLSVGMAVAMLIGLWVYDELSFNKYHKNYGSIAQLEANANFDGKIYTIDTHPMPLATELQTLFGSYFKYVVMSTQEQHVLSVGDKKFTESGNFMQHDAPDMLTLNMLKGSRAALKQTASVMLSASLSKKLFNDADPINKLVTMDGKLAVKVTGVYEDLPDNSDFKDVSFIAPFDFYLSSYNWAQKKSADWNNRSVRIYTQLNPNQDAGKVTAAIKHVLASHLTGTKAATTVFLQPMSRWRLYSKFENGVNVTSDQLRFVWFYSIIGGFVLLLACINFMNLSTARSEKRAKEVGIRKTMGSARSQLIKQFFVESLVVAFVAFALSLMLVQLALPWFNGVAGKKIVLPYTSFGFGAAGIVFTLFTGVVAGSYPALYLSSFNPVKVLKGTFRAGRFAALPRQMLVVLQFTVSIALIIGTITVFRQIQFAKNRPLGYNQQNLLQVQLNSPEFEGKYNLFSSELKTTGAATEVAESASPATSIWSTNTGFTWKGGNNTTTTEFATIAVTPQYGKTVGWQFTAGRDFDSKLTSDSTGFVLNEAAVKLMGLKNPVGQTIGWDAIKDKQFTVLGVVKDMVMESPFASSSPTIFFIYPKDGANCMLLKLNPNITANIALDKVESVFKKLVPSVAFEYSFVNDDFNRKFAAEESVGTLAGVFATLAIFISCLGLFGMASFVAEQRTKEIGVRKVLGASIANVWALLSKDFALLVIVALLIASPIAYYFMHNWLMGYAVRTELSWWIFAITGAGAIFITLATVSYQSIKAALMNPVKSLKTE